MAKRPKISGHATTKTLPKNFFSTFNKRMLVRATDETREIAKDLSKEAKDIIRSQRYAWKPLKEKYRDKKVAKGLDERILMATKEYVNKGIGHFEKDGYIFVGPKSGTHKPSGLSYNALSRIHEFGTWSIPARPLWRPLLAVALKKFYTLKKKLDEENKKDFEDLAKNTKVKKVKL